MRFDLLLIAGLLVGLLVICCNVLIVVGALRMLRFKNYGLAITACILAMITPPLVLGLPVGLVVEPGILKVLAEAVINVLDNSGDFQSHYTKQLEEKYSWKNIAEATVRCYEKAIGLWR